MPCYEVVTTQHFDLALRACDRAMKWPEALALFERMRARGLRPTAKHAGAARRTSVEMSGQYQRTNGVVVVW